MGAAHDPQPEEPPRTTAVSIGNAGEHLIMAELLYRGYQAFRADRGIHGGCGRGDKSAAPKGPAGGPTAVRDLASPRRQQREEIRYVDNAVKSY